MSNSTLIKLIAFDNAIDANLLKLSLENEGIETYIFDENTINIDPLISYAIGGVKVMIKESDLEYVRKVVAALDNAKYILENNEVVTCPNCSSDNVHSYSSMKDIKSIMAIVLALIFIVYPPYKKNIYKCDDCGNEFKKPEE